MEILNYEAMRAASREALMIAHRELGDRIRYMQGVQANEAMQEWRIGELAEFDTNKAGRGPVVRIKVTKFNQKTVSGNEVDRTTGIESRHRIWRVSPTLLRRVV